MEIRNGVFRRTYVLYNSDLCLAGGDATTWDMIEKHLGRTLDPHGENNQVTLVLLKTSKLARELDIVDRYAKKTIPHQD